MIKMTMDGDHQSRMRKFLLQILFNFTLLIVLIENNRLIVDGADSSSSAGVNGQKFVPNGRYGRRFDLPAKSFLRMFNTNSGDNFVRSQAPQQSTMSSLTSDETAEAKIRPFMLPPMTSNDYSPKFLNQQDSQSQPIRNQAMNEGINQNEMISSAVKPASFRCTFLEDRALILECYQRRVI
ncbi:hypothetical protein SSS_06466 [Sarcoptes scabiei]|uniref:Uncharacterized protein n=1 Tax=Sarcoptes scabiei TaxID=52283 RepID=A0A834V957_SARSC|nr:hypothetical protein SSS_06466 [Sarcoptes scabiei]